LSEHTELFQHIAFCLYCDSSGMILFDIGSGTWTFIC